MEMDDVVLIPDFEVQEIDEIHEGMLENVNPRYDKTEGQFVWDETRPFANESHKLQVIIENFYFNSVINSSMASQQLTLRTREFGVDRKSAIKAKGAIHFTGETGTPIPVGTIARYIGIDDVLEYISTEDATISAGEANVPFECTTPGAIGNIPANSLRLVEDIPGIDTIGHDAFVGGVDEESDEALLKRFLEEVRNPGISGNPAHYRQWAMSRPGVAECRVYPVWNGGGTVKIVLLDENGKAPTQSIIDDVQQYIESVCPIGADPTVVGVNEVLINIEVRIQPASNADIETIRQQFIPAIQEYLKSLAFKDPLVRWTRISNLLGDITDIIDYENLTVNGGTANIEMKNEDVAVLGEVNFYE
ncbi:Uncharacterized phage protein gp47/JayE [Aneurinibacillus migulanus]|uniref:Uncharacterized phage protein gp47/JayE n=3 Tax=Aneurinibacillus migulanus TaxID=47500 RepID=A0A1G8NVZ4_ANEMI|nr:Uncharacterized phage protein gp47/JayE [Aneurinibacillus migulanus]